LNINFDNLKQKVVTETYNSVEGPLTPKLIYHFPNTAQFSENFDSNIGTQRFVNMKKFTFEVDNLQKSPNSITPTLRLSPKLSRGESCEHKSCC